MADWLLYIAAALLIATGAVHSLFGERLLIGPLLFQREGILTSEFARFVLRFAWHVTTVTWAVLALVLAQLAHDPAIARSWAAAATGVTFSGLGLYDLVCSRGRHMGWPLLTGIGIAALLSLAF